MRHTAASPLLLAVFLLTTLLAGVMPSLGSEALAQTVVLNAGPLPLRFEPRRAVSLAGNDAIEIKGQNNSGKQQILAVRIDDIQVPNFQNRFNQEQPVAPGEFSVRIPLTGLKTSGGRKINLRNITRVIVFALEDNTAMRITKIQLSGKSNEQAASQQNEAQSAKSEKLAQTGRIDFATGSVPIEIDNGQKIQLASQGRIQIAGRNKSGKPVTLVLRVDDKKAPPYADRHNGEFRVAPGAFTWNIPIKQLTTPSGRALDQTAITRIILFSTDQSASVSISKFSAPGTSGSISLGQASDPLKAPERIANLPPKLIGKGPAPIEFSSKIDLSQYDEFIVEGQVQTKSQAGLVLRVDDGASSSYATRFNQERMLPNGPFRFTVGIKGLRATNKRYLDATDIRAIILFPHGGEGSITISRFELRQTAALPTGVKAYAFGAAEAAVPPGFTRLSPNSEEVKGIRLRPRTRPMPDPLVANGLEGLSRVQIPMSPGNYRVTLWSEDPGEWEILPQIVQQSIEVNGVPFIEKDLNAEQWIEQRYVRNKRRAHAPDDNAWSAYGKFRGGMVSKIVRVDQDGLTVNLSGDRPEALFLNALVIEPENSRAGLEHVQQYRRNWYRDNWPVRSKKLAPYALAHPLKLDSEIRGSIKPIRVTAARGTGVRVSISLSTREAVARPKFKLTSPSLGKRTLPSRIWAGLPKLERVLPSDTTLTRTDSMLMADIGNWPLYPMEPRSYEIWINVPRNTAPGSYKGSLEINGNNARLVQPVEVEVLPLQLKAAKKPVGFYLANAAHLNYFRRISLQKDQQAACDLRLMTSFGLRGTAPPMPNLGPRNITQFRSDMQRAKALGVASAWLAYNPIEFLRQSYELPVAAETVGRAMKSVRGAGISPPVWSAADEPSNADRGSEHLEAWTKALRQKAPGIKLGGHLNNKGDRPFVRLFDTIIINPGYGLNVNDIRDEVRAGRQVWLYNTFRPRLTAGFWLWRTKASRYVQWHARMPTADPFDPIDGREGDVQMIFPDTTVCQGQPDIHRDLLAMAEGVVDQQWLNWLSSNKSKAAKKLSSNLTSLFGGNWDKATKTNAPTLEAIRTEIIEVYLRTRGQQ